MSYEGMLRTKVLAKGIATENMCNYADDNTIWTVGKNVDDIIYKLETEVAALNKWFKDNSLLLNEDKCNFMIFEHKQTRTEKANIKIGNATIEKTKKAKLLGITLDSKLNFEEHIKNLCKEAGKKINALVRITPYVNEYKRSLLMKTFILSHFNCCLFYGCIVAKNLENLLKVSLKGH